MNRKLAYSLLWSTIEDYSGLWELFWEVNSTLKGNSSHNKELTRKILLYFLENNLIKLYFDKWGNDQLEEVDSEEAREIVMGEKFWSPPKLNDICVKIGSTDKGEEYYNRELIGEL